MPPLGKGRAMIFRQLFEPTASAYTYLIGCEDTREAALIDPVLRPRIGTFKWSASLD